MIIQKDADMKKQWTPMLVAQVGSVALGVVQGSPAPTNGDAGQLMMA